MGRWTRILLGIIIVGVAAFVTLVEVSIPSRPVRDLPALTEARDRPLNIVFILVDTLRADRMSVYGHDRATTPHLEELLDSGVRFAQVEAQSSWTKTSMASLWTGLFPIRTGVLRFDHGMPQPATMPAEILKEAGYATAGIFRNGWVAPNFFFDQGFDLYIRPTQRPESPADFQRKIPGTKKVPGTDLDLTLAGLEFVKTHSQSPFFLYLHYMDVHQYAYDEVAAAQGYGGTLSDAYDASIHWTDRNVNWLIHELERLEVLDNTLVVLASDHGEAFNEHGLEGHANDLYRETTDVPLLFILPIRLPEPLVVEPLVRNVDVWPTILDIAGLPPLPDADGQSLWPLMLATAEGKTLETPSSLSYLDQRWGRTEEEPDPLVAIRGSGTGRVMWNTRNPAGTLQIYDHELDPGEQNNLVTQPPPPEWTAALKSELQQQIELPPAWGEADSVTIDEMYKAQLRALGYMVD